MSVSIRLQPLASLAQLSQTPSGADGISWELEDEMRVYGCKLIQQAGILLKQLSILAMATAQVLFQRFWYVTSMKQFGVCDIGMGALYLASKLEECPVRTRDLINVYDLLLSRARYESTLPPPDPARPYSKLNPPPPPFKYTPMDYFAQAFYDMKDALVVAEMQILKRLGFNVHVQLPYGTMVNYLQVMGLAGSVKEDEDDEDGGEKDEKGRASIPQLCWGYLNDALQTPVYALFPFPAIACASILLSTRIHGVALPEGWHDLFDAGLEDIMNIAGHIMRLYRDRNKEEGGLETQKRAMELVVGGKKDVRKYLDAKADASGLIPL